WLTGSDANLPKLFEQPWLSQLSRLWLGELPRSKSTLSPADLKALASCSSLAGLRSLRLTKASMYKRVDQLAGSPLAGALQALTLADDALTPDDLTCLDETFPRLNRLVLSAVVLDRKKLDALLTRGWPKALTSLQLLRSLPSDLVTRLIDSSRLAGLEELN